MKTLKSLFILAFFSLFLISCKKDDDNGGGGGDSTMTAMVDGSSWSADLAVQGSLSSTNPQVLSIGGTGSQGQINLTVGNYTGTGTYTIGLASPSTSAIYTLTASPFTSYSATAVAGSGSIVVTSATASRIEGTFSFTGVNNSSTPATEKNITQGVFKINL